MSIFDLMGRGVELVGTPGALRAMLTWPRFSVTSFLMVRRLALQGLAPRTVIDVGANTGQFAVASARIWQPKRLLVVEPQPSAQERLQRVLSGISGASLHACALGENIGKASLQLNAHSHSSSLKPLATVHSQAFPELGVIGTVEVEVDTLEHLLGAEQLPGPVLLKIDVQGFEREVLAGARRALAGIDHILVEMSFKPMYEGERTFVDLLAFIQDLGFGFDRPVDFLKAPRTHEILQIDALFSRKTGR